MRRHLVLAVIALAVASAAWAEPRPFRTRAANDRAWQLIEGGLTRSETIRHLVRQLEQSDLIVVVDVCRVTPPALGDTRIVAAADGVRFLRIRVTATAAKADQLVVLGHELRHAVEIAEAPDVRDDDGQRKLGQRLGWSSPSGHAYETEPTIKAGDAVRMELRRSKTR